MLHFNRLGLLTPNTIIQSSLEELKTVFVDNISTPARLIHFNSYLEYSNQLKILCGNNQLKQWINRSFVTKKASPGDIDFITFIDHRTILSIGAQIKRFIYPYAEEIFKVDAYVVEVHPPGSSRFQLYQNDSAYWRSQFDRTRRNRVGNRVGKGFLEIFY